MCPKLGDRSWFHKKRKEIKIGLKYTVLFMSITTINLSSSFFGETDSRKSTVFPNLENIQGTRGKVCTKPISVAL